MRPWHTPAILAFVAVTVSGCASWGREPVPAKEPMPVTVVKKQHVECGPPPLVDTLSLRPTPPVVLWGHPKGTELPDAVWVGMQPRYYENLGSNLQDLKKTIVQEKVIVSFYQKCINDYNSED